MKSSDSPLEACRGIAPLLSFNAGHEGELNQPDWVGECGRGLTTTSRQPQPNTLILGMKKQAES